MPSPPKRQTSESSDFETDWKRTKYDSNSDPPFDQLLVHHRGLSLDFRRDLVPASCVEDIQPTKFLRSLINNQFPLPETALHVHAFIEPGSSCEAPVITFAFPAPVQLKCTASISSPKLSLIPCELQITKSTAGDGRFIHTTRIKDISASLDDAVIVLKYFQGSPSGPLCVAVIFCDLKMADDQSSLSVVKLISRGNKCNVQGSTKQPNILSTPIIHKKRRDRGIRFKPNLSLSIPPAPPAQISNLLKSTLAKTPLSTSTGGFCTPLDQRIQTPTVPPPLKSEVTPYVLRNFVGTPTEPFSPVLEHTFAATSTLNRVTMKAISEDTSRLFHEDGNCLASPLASELSLLRKDISLCHTPGGYFRA